jgi:hypothetical protein
VEPHADIRNRIIAALESMPAFADGPDMTPTLMWQLDQFMGVVPVGKLSQSALAALVVIFATEHARLMATDDITPQIPTKLRNASSRLTLVQG